MFDGLYMFIPYIPAIMVILGMVYGILVGGLEHDFSIYWECHHPK